MPDVTLNEYSNVDSSDEDISYDRLFETPPHIPVERVSLTSEEPDLEFVFDNVIDVEKLEEVGDKTNLPRHHRRWKQATKGKVKGQIDLNDENDNENLDETSDKQAIREHRRRGRKIDEYNRVNETGNEILDDSSDQKKRKNHQSKKKNYVDGKLDEIDETLNDSSDRIRRKHRRRRKDIEVDDSIEADEIRNENRDELLEKKIRREHRGKKMKIHNEKENIGNEGFENIRQSDDEGHIRKIRKENEQRRGKLSRYEIEEDERLGEDIVVENADDETKNRELRGERHRREKTYKNGGNDGDITQILDEFQEKDVISKKPKTKKFLSNNIKDHAIDGRDKSNSDYDGMTADDTFDIHVFNSDDECFKGEKYKLKTEQRGKLKSKINVDYIAGNMDANGNGALNNKKTDKHFDDLDENPEDAIFDIVEISEDRPERGYIEMKNADKREQYVNEGGVIRIDEGISKTKLTKNVLKNQKRVRKKKKESEEPSFDSLPSIHDTLAKILPKDKFKLLDKLKTKLTPEEEKNEETDSTTLDLKTITDDEGELSNIILISALTRPKSASAECFIVPTFPRILRRISSLPNITDIDQQHIDLAFPPEIVPCQTCGEQKPESDHICLPKFKIRFKAKKTKGYLYMFI